MSEKIEIDVEDFPANSQKAKKDEKIVIKVAEGELIEEKPGFLKLFKNIFSGENLHGVFTYILEGVIAPAFKNMIYDAGTKGLERAMWGEDSGRGAPSSTGVVNYSAISTRGAKPYVSSYRGGYSSPKSQSAGIYRLASRVEAEEVLHNLKTLIHQYGHASVADYYEMVGKTGTYTDNKWGWTTLNHARIDRAPGGGYVLTLPKATPID